MSDDSKSLIDSFGKQALRIIGDGRNRETDTDVVEWSDPEEARYNAKMGLDKYGMPRSVNKVFAQREDSAYHMTLSEGMDLLGDGYDDDTPIDTTNDFFNPSGFNDW